VASYHLAVKSVRRSEGRSATAAAAYRHAARIVCEREGRTHDYRAKAGVEASILVLPAHAPTWAEDREALWNAAEARETRVNSVTAREWELALPHELGAEGRRALVEAFARELAGRYGVAADVAIHAPHREGDGRNWHAHVLTTTRELTAEGLTEKTRVLDAKQTGGHEVEHMRARWAEMQNHALDRARVAERVDHRTLAAQREAALAHGDEAEADSLDRAPEVKLGPVVSAVERREQRAAEREGHAYVPLTERGAQVHEARAARSLLAELARLREVLRREAAERAAHAREAYQHAREEGTDRVRAGLAALRAAAERQGPEHDLGHELRRIRERRDEPRHEQPASAAGIKERLGRLLGREAPHHARDAHHAQGGPAAGLPTQGESWQDRQGHERGHEAHGTGTHEVPGADAIKERPAARREGHEEPSHGLDPINARLRAMLARERPRHDEGHERDGEAHRQRHRHRERGHEDDEHGWGL
jgi:hypothetical protein